MLREALGAWYSAFGNLLSTCQGIFGAAIEAWAELRDWLGEQKGESRHRALSNKRWEDGMSRVPRRASIAAARGVWT